MRWHVRIAALVTRVSCRFRDPLPPLVESHFCFVRSLVVAVLRSCGHGRWRYAYLVKEAAKFATLMPPYAFANPAEIGEFCECGPRSVSVTATCSGKLIHGPMAFRPDDRTSGKTTRIGANAH